MKKNLLPNTAIVLGLANALIVLLSSFGVRLSDQQVDAVQGVLSALLVVAGAYFHPDVPFGPHTSKDAPEIVGPTSEPITFTAEPESHPAPVTATEVVEGEYVLTQPDGTKVTLVPKE